MTRDGARVAGLGADKERRGAVPVSRGEGKGVGFAEGLERSCRAFAVAEGENWSKSRGISFLGAIFAAPHFNHRFADGRAATLAVHSRRRKPAKGSHEPAVPPCLRAPDWGGNAYKMI